MTAKNTFKILLRNNLIVTAVSFILGGGFLSVGMIFPDDSIFQAIAFPFLFLSMFAFVIYPAIAYIFVKTLPRWNFLSVAAPAVILIAIAVLDYFTALNSPTGLGTELSGAVNHIALCAFCHFIGPGIPLMHFDSALMSNELLSPGPAGWGHALPVTLIAAFYPSALFYLGVTARRIYENWDLSHLTPEDETNRQHAHPNEWTDKDKEASSECQYFNSESENEGTQ